MSGHVLGTFGGPGGWPEGARALGIREVGIELDTAACATRRAAGHRTIYRTGFRFYGIITNGTARCVNTKRPLTHSLDLGEEGLVMHASQQSARSASGDDIADETAIPSFRRRVGDRVVTSREEWNAARGARRRELYAHLTPEELAARNAQRKTERAAWSPERQEAARARDRERYAGLSPEERKQKKARKKPVTEEQRQRHRERSRARYAAMPAEKKERKLQRDREQMRLCRAAWTPEEREQAQAEHAERERKRRATLTDAERAIWTLRQTAKRLGYDPAEIEAHFKAHDGRCDICGRTPAEVGGKSKSRLSIDHDHRTGVFRGLLCPHCNYALGQMGDSPQRLMAAAEYLLKASDPHPSLTFWGKSA